MNEPKTQQTLLDAVAEEFTARFRQGERPSVEEYAARYPEAASQIRELLPSIVLLEQLKPPRLPSSRPESAAPPQQLGDYRIVREVGRGGMGIVYEAMQQSLGRRVALKLLPHHAHLDARRLERFRIEAQAAARLHHSNIVPVFGLFESDGLQYYVMQFIEGRGLDAVLTDPDGQAAFRETQPLRRSTVKLAPGLAPIPVVKIPTAPVVPPPKIVAISLTGSGRAGDYFRQVARIGVQAAQALNYAHAQGVLHRDIKPANLLLDEQGTVWITDFGLAKLREADGLTATGDLVGTLQYMPPESLLGQSGPQSDIYSLGLTLYELITRKPCFREVTPAKLLKLISEQDPVRPRAVDPSIPRDLETIVLKAIAREPRDRYATAGALADDLQRFVEDRPIKARRSSSLERLWRWSRRNRALAGSAAAALMSLVLAAVVGWWAYASTTHALKGEEDKRLEAEMATRHAEANMRLSLQALEEIFAAVAPPDDQPRNVMDPRHPGPRQGPPEPGDGPGARRGPRGEGPRAHHDGGPEGGPNGDGGPGKRSDSEKHRAVLLQAVLAFYERFALQNEADPKLQSEAAKAQCHIGEIHAHLGEVNEARLALQRSATSFAALVKEFPQQGEYLAGLLDTYRAEAFLARNCGDQVGLVSAADKARSTGDRLLAAFDSNANDARVAVTYREIAELLESSGDLPSAEKFYRLAVPIAQRLLGVKFGRPGGAAEDLAILYGKLAATQAATKRPAEARATLQMSIAQLLDQRRNHERDHLLAEQYQALADLTDDDQQAAELREKADELERAKHPRKEHPHADGPRGPHPPDPFEESGPRPPPPPFGPLDGPPPR